MFICRVFPDDVFRLLWVGVSCRVVAAVPVVFPGVPVCTCVSRVSGGGGGCVWGVRRWGGGAARGVGGCGSGVKWVRGALRGPLGMA